MGRTEALVKAGVLVALVVELSAGSAACTRMDRGEGHERAERAKDTMENVN